MCVKWNGGEILIPKELQWLHQSILEFDSIQKQHNIDQKYIYVTVRSGPVVSEADDVWHVDGFSTRIEHIPEQNYIFSNNVGTEFCDHSIPLPDDFDPLKHNIHNFFNSRVREYFSALENKWYGLDPYVIHRRPPQTKSLNRTFVRISFVPIPITSDGNTPNELIKIKKWNTTDFRTSLVNY